MVSHSDVLRASSRVPPPTNVRGGGGGRGTRDEALRTSAWEATFCIVWKSFDFYGIQFIYFLH